MSKMSIYLHDAGGKLNPNREEGFNTAVNNGQVRLALEYARSLIADLKARVTELESKEPEKLPVEEVTPIITETTEVQPVLKEIKPRTPRKTVKDEEEIPQDIA